METGQKVKVVKIIDGDELSVALDSRQFIIRMLGLYSYDPTVNDRQIQNIAALAFNYLNDLLANTEVEIRYDEYKKDKEERLLAYIQKNGQDVGRVMLEKGYSIVYTKYPFSRMREYLEIEKDARSNKRGLWGLTSVVNRTDKLRQIWDKSGSE